MAFDYFYEEQSQQFAFYRIPKVLFTDNRFQKISTEGKVLYGLLLDRVSLSRENGSDYPEYSINANSPGFSFLQSWQQVLDFRQKYRNVLDKIRQEHGESVTIHLYPATPNPINFEIGKGIMKNLDPTIILYDKTSVGTVYREVMCLHKRIRE